MQAVVENPNVSIYEIKNVIGTISVIRIYKCYLFYME